MKQRSDCLEYLEIISSPEYIAWRECTSPTNHFAPIYELIKTEEGVFAVFNNEDEAYEYDLIYQDHFDCCVPTPVLDGYGFYLGRLQ